MGCNIHIVPEKNQFNGVYNVAKLLATEDNGCVQMKCTGLDDADEVWVHGMWLPREWYACWCVLRAGKKLVRMTHGSLSQIYLRNQGRWKKTLVGPVERFFLRRASVVVATCEAEAEWIRAYEPRVKKIEIADIKRFFALDAAEPPKKIEGRALHLLYLGRRHPLKGLEYLESAVKGMDGVELKTVSNAFGEEKEKVWDWCDVLVLPTLSENFGLVIAEALEKGKCVITTDGAPAWGDGNDYGGRLVYLKGFRDGDDNIRVNLLKSAIQKKAERREGERMGI